MKSILGISNLDSRVAVLLCLQAAGLGGGLAWAQSSTPADPPQTEDQPAAQTTSGAPHPIR